MREALQTLYRQIKDPDPCMVLLGDVLALDLLTRTTHARYPSARVARRVTGMKKLTRKRRYSRMLEGVRVKDLERRVRRLQRP